VARKLRLEYPGALYHVINRGNYRRDVFETAGAAQSFVDAMEEGVQRFGWRLQAYVLMRNHFHLVVETPEPNLTVGMHWLLTTVATRFNRFRRERGHLFQGRYQALPIEDFSAMAHVIDYVHLNPVRAGIMAAEQIVAFRWSSLRRFVKGPRFPGLDPAGALECRGWKDFPEGWVGYVQHLIAIAGNVEEQRRLGYDKFSSGWAIGTQAWRRELAREHAHLALAPGLGAAEARELREGRWREALDQHLQRAGRSRDEALGAPKTAPWKLELAQGLRDQTGATMAWLARELGLGAEGTARSLMSKLRRAQIQQYSA
jgi:REP element-mobilizing transposase RayT